MKGKPITFTQLKRISDMLDAGESPYVIAPKVDVLPQTVYFHFREKIAKRRIERTLEKYEAVREEYKKTFMVSKVIDSLGVCEKTVKDALTHFGIKQIDILAGNQHARKHPTNESFFEIIDTEEKAYWLGFMYADGCVNIRKNPNRRSSMIYVAQIGLAEKDGYMVRKLSVAIHGKNLCKKYIYKNRSPETQNQIYLAIRSKKMVEDLIKQGCFQRKSLTLRFPTSDQVPDHLLHHFIRGYFDGDGSTGIYGPRDQGVCSLISSNDFCRSFSELMARIDIKTRIDRSRKRYAVVYLSSPRIPAFADYIYRDATIWLKRKRVILNRIKKSYAD